MYRSNLRQELIRTGAIRFSSEKPLCCAFEYSRVADVLTILFGQHINRRRRRDVDCGQSSHVEFSYGSLEDGQSEAKTYVFALEVLGRSGEMATSKAAGCALHRRRLQRS
jgi:hypothetical protein